MRLALLIAAVLASAPLPAAAHPAYGIVADAQGRVTFSDLERVWRIEADGRLRLLRAGGGWHTHELAIDPAGAIYGEQSTYVPEGERYLSGLWRIGPDGRFSWLLPPTESPPKGLSLWRDRRGATYATHWKNHRDRGLILFRRSAGGELTVLHGDRRDAAAVRQTLLSNIGGTTVAPDGRVWLTNGPQLWRVEPSGAVARVAWRDSEPGPPPGLRGLAVDAAGVAIVADMDRRRVLRIAADGGTRVIHRSAEGWLPTGVALSPEGLFLLEAGRPGGPHVGAARVLRLEDRGPPQELARVRLGER